MALSVTYTFDLTCFMNTGPGTKSLLKELEAGFYSLGVLFMSESTALLGTLATVPTHDRGGWQVDGG